VKSDVCTNPRATRERSALRCGVAIGAIGVAATAFGCTPTAVEDAAFSAQARALVVRLDGVDFQRFVGEHVEFDVVATKGVFAPEQRTAQLEGVEMNFRHQDRGSIRLRAGAGEFDFEKRTFVMRGGVEGQTAGGERFSTSQAHYDRSRSRIVVDQPVTLQSGRVVSRGSGLVFNIASRELTLFDMEGRREGGP
jgi:LPS export ABC transporter protein LptC